MQEKQASPKTVTVGVRLPVRILALLADAYYRQGVVLPTKSSIVQRVVNSEVQRMIAANLINIEAATEENCAAVLSQFCADTRADELDNMLATLEAKTQAPAFAANAKALLQETSAAKLEEKS